jgi:uncharacterized protein (UPF0335 family)
MPDDPKHNTGGIAADQLCSFVSRIERLNEEGDALANDKKEVYSEAKATGFDVTTLKLVIKRRRQDKADRQESDAMLELYESIVNGVLGT